MGKNGRENIYEMKRNKNKQRMDLGKRRQYKRTGGELEKSRTYRRKFEMEKKDGEEWTDFN